VLWGSHFAGEVRQNFRQALLRLRRLLDQDVLLSHGTATRLSEETGGPQCSPGDPRAPFDLMRDTGEERGRVATSSRSTQHTPSGSRGAQEY
jgi:hypothetical protein